jgi:hypothetical protein
MVLSCTGFEQRATADDELAVVLGVARLPVDDAGANVATADVFRAGGTQSRGGRNTAANAGVPPDKAGLAAALVNASTWLGGALGLAIFSVIATTRTNDLLAAHASQPDALTYASAAPWSPAASSLSPPP